MFEVLNVVVFIELLEEKLELNIELEEIVEVEFEIVFEQLEMVEQSDQKEMIKVMVKGIGFRNILRLGGKKGDVKSYFNVLMVRFNEYKDYLAEVKKEKQQGVVVLKFFINKKGEVIVFEIKISLGYLLLDKVVLDMLVKVNFLFLIFDFMGCDLLLFVIFIEYLFIIK